eukprot:COSAG01_NODE_17444_length_1151_cov_1.349810_1_plen_164_part_00
MPDAWQRPIGSNGGTHCGQHGCSRGSGKPVVHVPPPVTLGVGCTAARMRSRTRAARATTASNVVPLPCGHAEALCMARSSSGSAAMSYTTGWASIRTSFELGPTRQPQSWVAATPVKADNGLIPLQHSRQTEPFFGSLVYQFCMAQKTFQRPSTRAARISKPQ